MIVLLEIIFGLLRIGILLFTTLFVYLLGSNFYNTLNNFLYTNNIPCVELITFLMSTIPVIFVFYGISHKKYFWQRPGHYNWIIFITSYLIGITISFFPLDSLFALNGTVNPCPEQIEFTDKLAHAVSTGFIASLFAFVGIDIGVSLKHASHRVRRRKM